MWGRGPIGNNATCSALCQLSVTSSSTQKQTGPFWCWFQGGWVCVHSRTLWVSPRNSPVRLGVSPATAIPTCVFSQRLWGFISPYWNLGFMVWLAPQLSLPVYLHMNMGLPGLPATALLPVLSAWLPPPLLLLVWMYVSSSTPWSLDSYTVWFSGSSGCFLFLNWLLSFFWLCKEAQRMYLCLHLAWKSTKFYFWIVVYVQCCVSFRCTV